MEEIWKDVAEYEGLYRVSNLGRVESLGRVVISRRGNTIHKPRMILKNSLDRKGYYFVTLYSPGGPKISKILRVHRLVANAFIPNPENKSDVNHKDSVRTNNLVSNLEWATRSENIQHGYDNNHHGRNLVVRRGGDNPKSKKVGQFDLKGKLIRIFESHTEASRIMGIHRGDISGVTRGERPIAGGFVWKNING